MSNSIKIIGLMSGTSVDGLDICYVSFDNHDPSKYEIIDCETIDYDDNLKQSLKMLSKWTMIKSSKLIKSLVSLLD